MHHLISVSTKVQIVTKTTMFVTGPFNKIHFSTFSIQLNGLILYSTRNKVVRNCLQKSGGEKKAFLRYAEGK